MERARDKWEIILTAEVDPHIYYNIIRIKTQIEVLERIYAQESICPLE
jgi:hypothetical protein